MRLAHTLLPSTPANLHPGLLVPLLTLLNIYKRGLQKSCVSKQSSQHGALTDTLTTTRLLLGLPSLCLKPRHFPYTINQATGKPG